MGSDKSQLYQKALSILDLAPGGEYRVLDFGCGTGNFLGHVLQRVGNSSDLVGIDAKQSFIVQAQTEYPDVEFICEKFADRLAFADGSFDIVVTIDTIECIGDKEALVSEIHRVLKPGGKVLAMHWDWDTQIYNVESSDIARKAVWAFSDWKQPWMDECDGLMGRKLWGLFEGSKKFHGHADAFSLVETEYRAGRYGFDRMQDIANLADRGVMDKEEYERLCSELQESYATGQYLYSVTSFIYYGEKA